MATLGLGLIGVGRHGERYARHILDDLADATLVGICRRNRTEVERQAAALGCKAFTDYHSLMEDPRVDAVVVVVPPAFHPPVVEAAVKRGIAVLLEKPAAVSVALGRSMQQTVRQSGVPVMVAQTLRYNGVVRALYRERDRVGPMHAVRVSQRFEPSPLDWVDDPSLSGDGGILLHTGVHSFDLLRYLSGREPQTVMCHTGQSEEVSLPNQFCAVFRMQDGLLAEISGSRATRGRSGSIELVGSEGQLLGDHVENTARFVQDGNSATVGLPADLPTVRETLLAFTEALRTGSPMPVPLEEGLMAVAMAEACWRSAASGAEIPVESMS